MVHGLAKGVREDSRMNAGEKPAWIDAKEKDPRMFAPEGGGQYEKRYHNRLCAGCSLWQVYSQILPHSILPRQRAADWRGRIKAATKMRVKDAENASYNPYSRAKVLVPSWATMVYNPDDFDEDYDPPSPLETGRDFEGIEDGD